MEQAEKTIIMVETAQQLIGMIQKRMKNRIDALSTLQGTTIDSVPDEVKKMREVEAHGIRAVIQEQADTIEIIEMLFPKAAAASAGRKHKDKS